MPVPLPSFDDLPQRWTARDAGPVLAPLAASGLSAAEFARRTGISPNRLSRWAAQHEVPAPWRRGPGRRRAKVPEARLVELVPPAPVGAVPALVPVPPGAIEVRTPSGWQLRVLGELLGALVGVLAARSC